MARLAARRWGEHSMRFSLRLKVMDPQSEPRASSRETQIMSKTIFLVVDSATVLLSISGILSKAG